MIPRYSTALWEVGMRWKDEEMKVGEDGDMTTRRWEYLGPLVMRYLFGAKPGGDGTSRQPTKMAAAIVTASFSRQPRFCFRQERAWQAPDQ
jgi:hypothetical protein